MRYERVSSAEQWPQHVTNALLTLGRIKTTSLSGSRKFARRYKSAYSYGVSMWKPVVRKCQGLGLPEEVANFPEDESFESFWAEMLASNEIDLTGAPTVSIMLDQLSEDHEKVKSDWLKVSRQERSLIKSIGEMSQRMVLSFEKHAPPDSYEPSDSNPYLSDSEESS